MVCYYRYHAVLQKCFGLKFPVEIEIELETAAADDKHFKWDWSNTNDGEKSGGLIWCINKSLEHQKTVYQDLDIAEAKKEILATTKNHEIMQYLKTNYPILKDWEDSVHFSKDSREYKEIVQQIK